MVDGRSPWAPIDGWYLIHWFTEEFLIDEVSYLCAGGGQHWSEIIAKCSSDELYL